MSILVPCDLLVLSLFSSQVIRRINKNKETKIKPYRHIKTSINTLQISIKRSRRVVSNDIK